MDAYFDNNIYVYIEEGLITLDQIQEKLGLKFDTIYYSNAHVQETLERKAETVQIRNERIENRLQIIQQITQNNYLNEGLDDILIKSIESPFDVLETISEVSFAQNNMKHLVNMIKEDKKQESRNLLSLNPVHLNNFNATNIINEIDEKLKLSEQDFTFNKLIDQSIVQSNRVNNLYNRTVVAFELLDFFGYYKDKFTLKSNYARLWDSIHTYYASYCDFFITNDKNTSQKASVVYNLNAIKTQILALNIN